MIREHLQRLFVSGCVAIAMVATGLPALAQSIVVPPVPSDIRVPQGNTAFVKVYAEGTQNYVCLPSTTGLAWKFQGPQATLFLKIRWLNGEVLQQVGTHFLSPSVTESNMPARATWQSSLDTSAVWAKKIAESTDPAFVATGAIPWFLLQATGSQRGPAGGGILTQTTFIQRINTTGGNVSSTGCSELGSIQFVPYTADYIFYRASGAQ